MNKILSAALILLVTSGCATRQILSVEDAVTGGTTVLSTMEGKNYILWSQTKYVFWECGEKGDGLDCQKRCDVKNDQGDVVKCQRITTFGLQEQ